MMTPGSSTFWRRGQLHIRLLLPSGLLFCACGCWCPRPRPLPLDSAQEMVWGGTLHNAMVHGLFRNPDGTPNYSTILPCLR